MLSTILAPQGLILFQYWCTVMHFWFLKLSCALVMYFRIHQFKLAWQLWNNGITLTRHVWNKHCLNYQLMPTFKQFFLKILLDFSFHHKEYQPYRIAVNSLKPLRCVLRPALHLCPNWNSILYSEYKIIWDKRKQAVWQ